MVKPTDPLAMICYTARELMSRDATAFELAGQYYDDLCLGHSSDQVSREIEQIVLPPSIPLGGSAAMAM
jgi:hypothetical protein